MNESRQIVLELSAATQREAVVARASVEVTIVTIMVVVMMMMMLSRHWEAYLSSDLYSCTVLCFSQCHMWLFKLK